MKNIQYYKDFSINENSKSSYSKGCVMLYFDFPTITKIQKEIDPEDIFHGEGDNKFGLEDEPHCTILYGLDPEVSTKQVKEITENEEFSYCKIHDISLFKNEYDVLKFEVKSKKLHQLNKKLEKLPFENDYPEYKPHLTIGYLKKGKGEKYLDKFKFLEYDLFPSKIVFSKPDGEKIDIDIKLSAG